MQAFVQMYDNINFLKINNSIIINFKYLHLKIIIKRKKLFCNTENKNF